MSTIRTLDFTTKLGDAYFVVYNTVNILQREDVKQRIVSGMTQGIDEMLLTYIVNKDGSKLSDSEKTKSYFIEAKKQFVDLVTKKVEEYEPVLYNQNLVMQCTILEIFFQHILEVIVEAKPQTLVGLAPEKSITIQQTMDAKNYEGVMEYFRLKTFDHFSRLGLKSKFEIYSKIGIEIDKVFDFSGFVEEVQKRYKNHNIDTLDKIFDKRL